MDRNILSKTVWFLDYDGSLCPHQESWEERTYSPAEVLQTLHHLGQRGAHILWNTGRRVESIGGMQPGFLDFSGFFIQGTIYWSAARKEALTLSPPLPAAYGQLIGQILQGQTHYKLELKPTSLRISSLDGEVNPAFMTYIQKIVDQTPAGWRWIYGQRAAELLPEGFDKGSAVVREMGLPFAKGLIPVAVGDDLFDRPAFVASLAHGGYAILIGDHVECLADLKGPPDKIMHFATPSGFTDWLRAL